MRRSSALIAIFWTFGFGVFQPQTMLGQGQPQPKIIDFNQHLWASYSGEHTVRGRWGIHGDGSFRRSEGGATWQQILLRPGVNYRISPNLMLTAGYTYVRTHPYGDFPAARTFLEHRAYEQVLVANRLHGLTVQNRSRLEQRFVRYPNNPPDARWTYQNRFRHMIRMEAPLGSPNNKGRWYVPVYDEVFLGIPPNFGARTFDQNRLAAGIGRSYGSFKAEVVYMNQFTGQRNGRVFEFNNTLVLSIMSSAPFSSFWPD